MTFKIICDGCNAEVNEGIFFVYPGGKIRSYCIDCGRGLHLIKETENIERQERGEG